MFWGLVWLGDRYNLGCFYWGDLDGFYLGDWDGAIVLVDSKFWDVYRVCRFCCFDV